MGVDPITLGIASLGLSAVGVGSSIFGASKASSAADKQASQQDKALQLQAEVAKEQLQMARDQWNNYLTQYDPIAGQLSDYYSRGIPQATAEIAEPAIEDVNRAFLGAERGLKLNAAQTGRTGGGAYDLGFGALIGQAAKARSEAKRFAREQARSEMTTGRLNFLGLGRGLPATAQSGLSGAAANQANIAGQYGLRTQQAAQAAGNWAGLGLRAANMGIQAFNQPTTTTPGSAWGVYEPPAIPYPQEQTYLPMGAMNF